MKRVPYLFFSGITGATLPHISAPGTSIFKNFKILTDKPSIVRKIGHLSSSIGNVEFFFLSGTSSAIAFSNGTFDLADGDDISERANGIVISNLAKLQNWLNTLWLMEDNAINHDTGWLAFRHDGREEVASNTWSNKFTRADGTARDVVFSKEQISIAHNTNILSEYGDDVGPVPLNAAGFHGEGDTKLMHDSMRFQRFLYFQTGARSARDLAIKVINYCSALEALVSSSSSELTHQIAERVAFLLGDDESSRLSIFRSLKSAYGMRSRAVHGSTFKESALPKLKDAAIDLDNICRRCTLKYFQEEPFNNALEADSNAFENYWLNLIFSRS